MGGVLCLWVGAVLRKQPNISNFGHQFNERSHHHHQQQLGNVLSACLLSANSSTTTSDVLLLLTFCQLTSLSADTTVTILDAYRCFSKVITEKHLIIAESLQIRDSPKCVLIIARRQVVRVASRNGWCLVQVTPVYE